MAVCEAVDADQSGYHFASDVFAKSPSYAASDVAGRAHPCAENLCGSNHGPGNTETWCFLDEGYGKQLDIICSNCEDSSEQSFVMCWYTYEDFKRTYLRKSCEPLPEEAMR